MTFQKTYMVLSRLYIKNFCIYCVQTSIYYGNNVHIPLVELAPNQRGNKSWSFP